MDSLPLYLQPANLIVYFVSLILAVWFGKYYFRFLRKQQVLLKKLAVDLGLTFVPKGPSFMGVQGWYMEGLYSDFKVEIKPILETRGSGNSRRRRSYLQFVVYFSQSLNLGLVISEESFWGKLGKMVVGQDIQVGNPEFDGQFLIKSTSESAAVTLLSSPIVQQSVLSLFELSKRASIDDEKILVQFGGFSADHDFYVKTLNQLISMVKKFK